MIRIWQLSQWKENKTVGYLSYLASQSEIPPVINNISLSNQMFGNTSIDFSQGTLAEEEHLMKKKNVDELKLQATNLFVGL